MKIGFMFEVLALRQSELFVKMFEYGQNKIRARVSLTSYQSLQMTLKHIPKDSLVFGGVQQGHKDKLL